jgi:hypothetical protein
MAAAIATLSVVGASCSMPPAVLRPPSLETPAAEPAQAAVRAPEDDVTLLVGDAAQMALRASELIWTSAPTVVVSVAGDTEATDDAADLAVELGAPLVLAAPVHAGATSRAPGATTTSSPEATTTPTPGDRPAPSPGATPSLSSPATPSASAAAEADATLTGLLGEAFERWETTTVVVVGDGVPALPEGVDVDVIDSTDPPESGPLVEPIDAVVLAAPGARTAAASATLAAAGATVLTVADVDPRDDPAAIELLSDEPDIPVVALGARLGPADRLTRRVATARTGLTLPDGRQTLFPHQRLVALYGHPQTTALGVLGEQGPVESVERARELAAEYEPSTGEAVLPAFEIIASVAAVDAGPDGDYSNETPISVLRPYVEAAGEAGVYVVLDLQSGRSDFVSQAKEYVELLALPHVGLALDPEWRLGPNQVHLRQIGSVSAAEVNEVIDWLAGVVRERSLPQKLLLLHQFQQRMITDRTTLDLGRDELAVVVQMDGDGTPGQKLATWRALRADAPEGLLFGWKNFYDEDEPTFTPEQTMAVTPTPWWVSYQ